MNNKIKNITQNAERKKAAMDFFRVKVVIFSIDIAHQQTGLEIGEIKLLITPAFANGAYRKCYRYFCAHSHAYIRLHIRIITGDAEKLFCR